MIWIIGGTSESGQLLALLNTIRKIVITVATPEATEFISDRDVIVGRMNPDQMSAFIRKHAVQTVVDVSHPYAIDVSRNAQMACANQKVTYLRFTRNVTVTGDALIMKTLTECLEYLKSVSGTVFFTTGSKSIKDFQSVRGANRFVYRVLPTEESIAICHGNGVGIRDIVAMLGPFSTAMNVALFKAFQATVVVMKNSGDQGGTSEKLKACRQLNITPIILDRPEEEGFSDLNELAEHIRYQMKRQ